MRDYDNLLFSEIAIQLNNEKLNVIDIRLESNEFLSLQYFLTRNFYYAVIIDDYPFEIIDKLSLLEALYYQVKLVTMHDLNWDAFEEALFDSLNNFSEFDGICLLFRSNAIKIKIPLEMKKLIKIVTDINKQSEQKRIKIVLTQ